MTHLGTVSLDQGGFHGLVLPTLRRTNPFQEKRMSETATYRHTWDMGEISGIGYHEEQAHE